MDQQQLWDAGRVVIKDKLAWAMEFVRRYRTA